MKKATILIVDDKINNIYALENLLGTENYTFFTADSGKAGLGIAFNKEMDLIILDVQMPDIDGFEVAKILKSNRHTKDIPLLFASAERKEPKSMVKGLEGGAIDYLVKPLDPEVTKAKVSVLVRLELQRKELLEKNATLEKYSILINNCSDIICTIDTETLAFEEFNTSMVQVLGYPSEDIKRYNFSFFLGAEDRLLISALRDSKKEKLSFETRICCLDRSIKWLHWNIVARNGKWFANARDISDVKEVEQIKNYLTTVVKQSNNAIYLHDGEGCIISWNEGATQIYGYSENEALKMKLWNFIPNHLIEDTQEVILRVMKGEQIESFETKRITKQGHVIDVLFSASVLTNPENSLKSLAITETDITEQKIADEEIKSLNADLLFNNQQLEFSNNELESFSYSVSHDLRAPLRSLNGYAEIILEDYASRFDPEMNRLFNIIKRNAIKMGALIDDLLEFSKLGKKELRKVNVDMNELLANVLGEMDQSSRNQVTIAITDLPATFGDYALLKQVMINLVSNAFKYSSNKENSLIEIGADPKAKPPIYYVRDNGVGFDMDYSSKLFGVFQRLHDASDFEGTGVGLAIVYRIVKKHGGDIWAESKPDQGATFYFCLESRSLPSHRGT